MKTIPSIWKKTFLILLIFLVTLIFFLLFVMSFFPLIGLHIGRWMIVPTLLLVLIIIISPRFSFAQKNFFTRWLRYSLYAVLIGFVANGGCSYESHKRLKKFSQETQVEKNNLKTLWQKIFNLDVNS